MPRPISPLLFIGIFLLVVIAAVLMFAVLLARKEQPPTSSPRQAVALQLALLKEGNLPGLRMTLTERLRERLTPEMVEHARPVYELVELDALVGVVEEKTAEDGTKEALVFTTDGRPLTRLVLVRGEWLADTVWFL